MIKIDSNSCISCYMKEEILRLRGEGKTYNEIIAITGASKGTVSYHCGDGQRQKTRERTRKSRNSNPALSKMYTFQGRKASKSLEGRIDMFQRERLPKHTKGNRIATFTWKQLIEKHGIQSQCYLTGRVVDLNQPQTYSFDHIIPISKGGDNNLNNLGITCLVANRAKNDMSVSEFLMLCKEVLEHNGYCVTEGGRPTRNQT